MQMNDQMNDPMNDQMKTLPVETWELVIDQIMDLDSTNLDSTNSGPTILEPTNHDSINRIVYVIWLMQVSKAFSTIARNYFKRRKILPNVLIPKGGYQERDAFVISDIESRYGEKVRSRHRSHNFAHIVYKNVRGRKVVTSIFKFNADRICDGFVYTDSEYSYHIELSGSLPTNAQLLSRSSKYVGMPTMGYDVHFDMGWISDIFTLYRGKRGRRVGSGDRESVKLTHQINEVLKFMSLAKPRAIADLYGDL